MNTLLHALMDLRGKVISLQQVAASDALQATDSSSDALARLRRISDELQSLVEGHRQMRRVATNGVARGNGNPSREDSLAKLERSVSPRREHTVVEQVEARYHGYFRALLADLLIAEEAERQRLAIDLHDGLSQTIALTLIKLESLRQDLEGAQGEACDEIRGLIQEADRTTRSITFELSPLILHDLGLEPALHWLVENIGDRYGIKILLELDGHECLDSADEKIRSIFFRSIREILINSAKHAKANRVRVRLRHILGKLGTWIEDDGIGMDLETTATEGSGLFSIQERLTHVGGRMRIRSAPGRGTRISLCASLANHELPQESAGQ